VNYCVLRRERDMRVITFEAKGGGNISHDLKVPRECPLVLLVEVCLREGKALRSEKIKS
jgi:hypothetical protein